MGNYYSTKLGLDVRGVRLPGLISWKVEPTAGTTDYAVAIFYGAIRENRYTCFLDPDSRLPMMYMPDAIAALIDVAIADLNSLRHHADFNVNAMSFTPSELAAVIRERLPGFEIDYDIDPLRQPIADSWPDKLDDTVARGEWAGIRATISTPWSTTCWRTCARSWRSLGRAAAVLHAPAPRSGWAASSGATAPHTPARPVPCSRSHVTSGRPSSRARATYTDITSPAGRSRVALAGDVEEVGTSEWRTSSWLRPFALPSGATLLTGRIPEPRLKAFPGANPALWWI